MRNGNKVQLENYWTGCPLDEITLSEALLEPKNAQPTTRQSESGASRLDNTGGIGMKSQWKGSLATAANVCRQIAERFGTDAAKNYDPAVNCFTFRGWRERGFQVKKGEKALKSVTFVPMLAKPKPGAETKEVEIYSAPRNVYLFCQEQVVRAK